MQRTKLKLVSLTVNCTTRSNLIRRKHGEDFPGIRPTRKNRISQAFDYYYPFLFYLSLSMLLYGVVRTD